MPDQEDLTLLHAIEGGDRAAFAVFLRRHGPAVRRFARSIVNDADAADATQETFLQVWRSAANGTGWRGEGSARSWLFTIARRAAWRRTRRRAGEPPVHDDIDVLDTVDIDLGVAAGWGSSPETLLQSAERRATVTAALATLSDTDREVLSLRDIAGLSGPDVAAALGISVAAEKSRLHRARLLLLAALRATSESS